MNKGDIKTVLIAVGVIIIMGRFELTQDILNGGNRFFN